MFKNILNFIENKYNQKKQETENTNYLMNKTTTFQNFYKIPDTLNEESTYKKEIIEEESPDINKEKASLISKLIPIEETIIEALYSKEILTNKEYYIIATNKYLWIINKENYGVFYYTNLSCTIIKNNLMSKIILLNNVLLEITGTNQKINELVSLINNKDYFIVKKKMKNIT